MRSCCQPGSAAGSCCDAVTASSPPPGGVWDWCSQSSSSGGDAPAPPWVGSWQDLAPTPWKSPSTAPGGQEFLLSRAKAEPHPSPGSEGIPLFPRMDPAECKWIWAAARASRRTLHTQPGLSIPWPHSRCFQLLLGPETRDGESRRGSEVIPRILASLGYQEAVSTLRSLKSIPCFGGKPCPAASCSFLLCELWECVPVEAGKLSSGAGPGAGHRVF